MPSTESGAGIVLGNLMNDERSTVTVTLRKDDEGFYIAECLEIPGCMSQGRTEDEAAENIKDAIDACLRVMLLDCLRDAAARRQRPMNLAGIERQEALTIVLPHLLQSQTAIRG